ncbi:MAG: hypothetical protein ACKPKO_02080, partial [Candidatus Fonsibacter sp.]
MKNVNREEANSNNAACHQCGLRRVDLGRQRLAHGLLPNGARPTVLRQSRVSVLMLSLMGTQCLESSNVHTSRSDVDAAWPPVIICILVCTIILSIMFAVGISLCHTVLVLWIQEGQSA